MTAPVCTLFVRGLLIPRGDNMWLAYSKSALFFFFFINELKLRNVIEASALCL